VNKLWAKIKIVLFKKEYTFVLPIGVITNLDYFKINFNSEILAHISNITSSYNSELNLIYDFQFWKQKFPTFW
jgi:hypothetical protein